MMTVASSRCFQGILPSLRTGITEPVLRITHLSASCEVKMAKYCCICHQCEGVSYPQLAGTPRLARTIRCSGCRRETVLIDISTASRCLGVCRRTIYDWIEKRRISIVHLAGGRLLIYYTSLYLPDKPGPVLAGNRSCAAETVQ